jgi:siroheme synthase
MRFLKPVLRITNGEGCCCCLPGTATGIPVSVNRFKTKTIMKSRFAIYPKLTLVETGNTDAGRISLSGINALRQADVVLYDLPANEALLKYAPAGAKRIALDSSRFAAEHIQVLIVDYAFSHGHVVRLISSSTPGDAALPYEEAVTAGEYNIETHLVAESSSKPIRKNNYFTPVIPPVNYLLN